jgi:putative two-component system response regulator
MAVEFRDKPTGIHIERMSQICGLLARQLGFDLERCRQIATASKLHDVGKIGIPDNILNKPGPLDEHERTIVEGHPEIGRKILANSGSHLLELAQTIAWTHHEHYDGNGYPRGLAGAEIPIEGRIAAVADVFDALLSNRPYRAALTIEETLQTMSAARGTHFDPDILDNFFASLDQVMTLSSTGDPGHEVQHPRRLAVRV